MQIPLKNRLEQNGYASAEEALAVSELDDLYPALCTEDCQVEPDGHCRHGTPSSLLLVLGDDLMAAKFPLGEVVSTPGALDALSRAG
jgi:hypothetical protein